MNSRDELTAAKMVVKRKKEMVRGGGGELVLALLGILGDGGDTPALTSANIDRSNAKESARSARPPVLFLCRRDEEGGGVRRSIERARVTATHPGRAERWGKSGGRGK